MNLLRRRFANTGLWVTIVGIAALAPLAATVVTTLRHATAESARAAKVARPATMQSAPLKRVGRAAVAAKSVKQVGTLPPAFDGLGSGLTPTFVTVPTPEVQLDAGLPSVAPNDTSANAFSMPDGRVCVVEMEEFRLRSLASSNGGTSFSAELDIAGGTGQPPVRSYSAARSVDGSVFIAYTLADPEGSFGLRFARSDDMCVTWTAPLTLVQAGDPTHGVLDVVLETGPSGKVSILYRGDRGWDPYVISSSDFGVNWTLPVRVDSGSPPRPVGNPVADLALALDSSGRIYVAYTQDRFGNGASVWTATSFDGGQTFEPERSFDSTLPAHGRSERPALRLAGDGSVLLAFWDSGGPFASGDLLYCLRSLDQGTSFVPALVVFLQSNSEQSFPLVLATAPGTQTVFLFTADDNNQLSAYSSPNNGANFFPSATSLATTASGSSDDSRPFTRIAWARAGSSWVVGWSDQAADTYAGLRTDAYLRSTPNEGALWSPPVRADSDIPGSSTSSMESIVATGNSSAFVLFRDGRPNNDVSSDVWATRVSLPLLTVVSDYRIDSDDAPVSPRVLGGVATAFDGVAHVFSAFPAVDVGPFTRIQVAVNETNNARTITQTAILISNLGSSGLDGARINSNPSVAATPDGFVFVAWTSYAPGGVAEVQFNRGVMDYSGVTATAQWLGSDQLLGVYPQAATLRRSETQVVQVRALPGGEAFILWSSDEHVLLSKWDEASQTASTQVVDQSSDSGNNSPRFCLSVGDSSGGLTWTATVAYLAGSSSGQGNTVWATTTQDGGQTWEPRVALRPETLPGSARQLEMSCNTSPLTVTATAAVAYWTDNLGGPGDYIFSSARQAAGWSQGTPCTSTAAVGLRLGGPSDIAESVTFTAQVAFEDSVGHVFVGSSFDAGLSFASFQQLDLGAPDPDARSSKPVAVLDQAGNSWVAWLDESAGLNEVAVARLTPQDAGGGVVSITLTALVRVSTTDPQGSHVRDWDGGSRRFVVTTGTAALAWRAQGASSMDDAVLNVYDLNDFDRDGTPVADDCDDANATVRHVPTVVSEVTVTALSIGPLRVPSFGWLSQSDSAGSSTTYDIVSGSLLSLRATGTFAGATCIAHGVLSPPYDDIRTGPNTNDAYLYLMRAVNSCGVGSFGDSSRLPDPRDQLDVPGICP